MKKLIIFLTSMLTAFNLSSQTKDCSADFAFKVDCRYVSFESLSNQTGITYKWTFGDGSTSVDRAVKHAYLKDGTYTVCLVTTRKIPTTDSICKDTICKKVIVQCGRKDPCSVSGNFTFKVSPNGTVGFNATSTGGFSYVWDFGDGTKAQGQNTTKQYSKPGVYNVCVTIYAKDIRCFVKVCKKVVIEERCNIYGNFTFQGIPGTMGFKFIGTSSEKTATYSWSFGDGTGASTKDPSKYYTQAGTYEVCLTIKTARCSTRICKKVVITKPSCSLPLSFGWVADKTNCLKYNFEAPIANCVVYKWYIDSQSYSGRLLSYTFSGAGNYQVCLKVADTCNRCDTLICKTISVPTCCRIESYFIIDSIVSGKVYITNKSTSNAVYYLWDFGDSSYLNSKSPSKTYASVGTYKICLSVWDQTKACSSTFCKSILITGLRSNVNQNFNDLQGAKVYPNPAFNKVTIECEHIKSVDVLDLNGRLLETILFSESNLTNIDLSNYDEGIYLIRINQSESSSIHRINIIHQ